MPPSVSGSLVYPLVQQAIVLTMGAMTLDGGATLRAVLYAAIAYWIEFFIILARRFRRLTPTDTIFIRWGYPALCIAAAFVIILIGRLRG